MMPSAPTDNLYKFVTFIGAALFLFCTWTMTGIVNEAERALTLYDGDQKGRDFADKIREKELVRLEARSDKLKKEVEDFRSNGGSSENSQIQVRYFEKETSDIKEGIDRLRLEQGKSADEQIRSIRDLSAITAKMNEIESQRYILGAGSIVGMTMFIFGILAWYLLHQRYQDEILRNQVKSTSA